MTRSRAALTAVLALGLLPDHVTARQPGAQVVGPTGPGLQPQVSTGPYLQPRVSPAARGVNPFAGPIPGAFNPANALPIPRSAGPRIVVPPAAMPAAPAANNPAAFNPGIVPQFPLQLPPRVVPANGVTYNPVFGGRRAVVSAYYFPQYPASPGASASGLLDPSLAEPGATFDPAAGSVPGSGEYRFIPWVW